MMNRPAIVIALLLASASGLAVVAWCFREPLAAHAGDWLDAWRRQSDAGPQPDPECYAILNSEVERWRMELSTRHQAADTPETKAAIEQQARVLLEQALPSMMRCWLGTRWDFNGTSETPGMGKIACGYFVSTVLRDAGFVVDRYRLAQQPSANIIHTFIPKNDCKLIAGASYDEFRTLLAAMTPGIYIVGLDTHVAFLIHHGDSFRFIHSSGSKPWRVVDESPEHAMVLQKSKWRMLGNLTASRNAVRTWLTGEPVKVVRH